MYRDDKVKDLFYFVTVFIDRNQHVRSYHYYYTWMLCFLCICVFVATNRKCVAICSIFCICDRER